MKNKQARNIDAYIAGFPEHIQVMLEQIRQTIRQAAPDAEETIKYAMPTFIYYGNLVHFAAFNHHIGFYPVPSGIEAFKKDLAVYKGAKGSVQFPLNQPMPLGLIARIVKFRAQENQQKAMQKKPATKAADGFMDLLAAPARRALENNGITNLQQLAELSEKEVLAFHGMGKSSIPKLQQALAAQGMHFKN